MVASLEGSRPAAAGIGWLLFRLDEKKKTPRRKMKAVREQKEKEKNN